MFKTIHFKYQNNMNAKGGYNMEYGLIGEKLSHSFSKEIHEQLADYTYDLHPIEKECVEKKKKKHEWKAINVTIPYKQTVMPYLDYIDDQAKAIGAVNTVVNKDGKLYGHNTDFWGFLYMCKKHNIQMEGKKVLVIGNGGASKAICAVVNHLKAKCTVIVDIVPADGVITYEECLKNHTDAEIIINTSPVGMYPKCDASPIDLAPFCKCSAVLDVIYNPLTTKLVEDAKNRGMIGVNGLEMLVAQAKYAVEFFLDKKIDDDVIDPIYKDIFNKMNK